MAKVDQTPLGDSIRELCDLKKVRAIVDLMCDGDEEKQVKVLELLPGLISAISKFAAKKEVKAEKIPLPDPKELDEL